MHHLEELITNTYSAHGSAPYAQQLYSSYYVKTLLLSLPTASGRI